MSRPWISFTLICPGDARGWIAVGCYSLVLVVLAMILIDKTLLNEDAFLILATAIVITGWVQGPVGWAYQATKGGGDASESNARIAEASAAASRKKEGGPAGTRSDPVSVAGAEEGQRPVSTKTIGESDG